MMNYLSEQTIEELKERYTYLADDLQFARNAFEFERTSDIKMEMVYIIEELKTRKTTEDEAEEGQQS
jgi:hypothetical protein